jgi:hypothetical protein
MMRSTVCGASWVWSVAKTRWPVSAGGQGGPDRLHVAHLADEDHVGVLAQGGLEGHGEGLGVRAELALVDQAPLVRVEELDRVLDGHDVLVARLVDLVDQRGERRRLARAVGPVTRTMPRGLEANSRMTGGRPELLDRDGLRGDQAERAPKEPFCMYALTRKRA